MAATWRPVSGEATASFAASPGTAERPSGSARRAVLAQRCATVARLTRRSPLFGGARQLGFGAAAAAVTYGIGVLMGASIF
ncbi:hypothetical protein [Streptosporangium sp. 'caverna']|uniref:hypothetical protein n=1 Tax=Streptosporangium sp. 'caverna' TaxID=2202249 RepID=UPI0013A70436|nr:hypothetical protein [Streptosporangium sp. 'caverna']